MEKEELDNSKQTLAARVVRSCIIPKHLLYPTTLRLLQIAEAIEVSHKILFFPHPSIHCAAQTRIIIG